MQCCREVSEEFEALRQTTRGCPEFRLSHLHLRHPLLLSPEWTGRTVAASQVPGWPNYRPKSNKSPSLTLTQGPQTLSRRWEGMQRGSGGLCVPVSWSRGVWKTTPNCLHTLNHQFMGTACAAPMGTWSPGHFVLCPHHEQDCVSISGITSVIHPVPALGKRGIRACSDHPQGKRGICACSDHPQAGKPRHRAAKQYTSREVDIMYSAHASCL